MKRVAVFASALVLVGVTVLAQEEKEAFPEPTFPEPKAQVLVLGTFHFADAGLDDFKPEFEIDVMSVERQAEVDHVLEALEEFAPTKIAVEVKWERQSELDTSFSSFLAGEKELTPNEIHQIGFRLGQRLEHAQLFAVDAERRFYEPWIDPNAYAIKNRQQEVYKDPWQGRYTTHYSQEDRAKIDRSIAATLLALNTEEELLRHHGHYLVESFKAGVGDEYPGADSTTAWYNRNLRIFANLLRITEQEDERILLIIGAGHVPVIRHAIQSSPEYELVEVADVLEP